jgi:fibronectin type 3 domain-containing protein
MTRMSGLRNKVKVFGEVFCQGLSFYLAAILVGGCHLAKDPALSEKLNLKTFNLVSYTSTVATVNVMGSLPKSGTSDLNLIKFYKAADCSGDILGQGLQKEFSNSGIQIQLPAAGNTKIYLSTNTLSACLYLGEYSFAPGRPAPPSFVNVVPNSPSRASSNPALFGSALLNSTVSFYSDTACLNQVGSGPVSDFSTVGLVVSLNANSTTTLYGQAVDALGVKSICQLMTEYRHTNTGPVAPVFAASIPASPSNRSATPFIKGTVSNDSVIVFLYKDAGCSSLLGTDTVDVFSSVGIQVTVEENKPTAIYAKAIDSSGSPSICSFLVNYSYDNVQPLAPTYLAADPVTPTRLTIYPRISGYASNDTVTVKFFNSPTCMIPIGMGSKLEFEGSGILVSVGSNTTTAVYAEGFDAAGNASACTHFVDYFNNTIPPDPPVFGTTNPVSDNNKSSTPLISGNASESTINLKFYSDSLCTNLIGSGSAAEYNGDGILLNTPAVPGTINTTAIYAEAIDAEGNISYCASLTSYSYSTAKAPSPSFLQTIPLSPSRAVTKPYVLGTSSQTISLIQLFSDSFCANLIGSANRSAFSSQGVQVTLNANSITNIYAVSTDKYGNNSDCVYFTNYIHDNKAPLSPSFISSNPISPNNKSVTPLIIGSLVTYDLGKPLPTSTVNFYDSMLCLNKIGTGTPADFISAGIEVSTYANAITNIFGQAADAAGNTSSCTQMLDYTVSTNPPGIPIFSAITPQSPSYVSKTVIGGSIGRHQDIVGLANVSFYRDALCNDAITSGPENQFTSSGLQLVVDDNATTTIYAQTGDIVGNLSACVHLTDYLHSNVAPTSLQAVQNLDGSIDLSWLPDMVANPSPRYIVKRAVKSGGPYSVIAWENIGTNFTDFAVANNKKYYYTVAATNNTGFSLDSAETSIQVNSPNSQQAISLTSDPGANVVFLQWQGFSPNLFYKVLRANQAGGPYTEITAPLGSTTYYDKTVSNNQSYYYVVVAMNPSGESVYSNETSVTVRDAPSAPINLKGVNLLSNPSCGGMPGVDLTWVAPSYYTTFMLKMGAPGSESDLNPPGPVTGNSYTHCHAVSDSTSTSTSFVVQAVWGPSAIVEVRSGPSNNYYWFRADGPTLTIDPGNNEIYVKWIANTYATSYQVWRSTIPGWPSNNYTLLDASFSGTNFYDANVINGTAYYYTVIANYANDEDAVSTNSLEASGMPAPSLGNPSNLKITQDLTSKSPSLQWSAPASYNGFNVYRATSAAGPFSFLNYTTATSFVDLLSSGGNYYYYIKSTWGGYESIASNIVSYRYASTDLLKVTPTATSLDLTWNAVSGANSYKVWRGTKMGGPYTNIASSVSALIYSNTKTIPSASPAVSGVGYYYVIQPGFADGTVGQYSAEVSAMLTDSNVPSGLTVTWTTTGSINLAWSNVVGTSTTYSVYRSSAAGGTYTSIKNGSRDNFYSDSTVNSNTTYYYKVSATVSGFNSSQSNYIAASAVMAPNSPGVSPGNSQVAVTWIGVIGASSYNILRSNDNINFSTIQTGATGGSYTDSSVTNGSIYFYKIQVIYVLGNFLNSPASMGVTPGVTPLVPQGISVTGNPDSMSVNLSWGSVSGASNYNVYLSTTSGGPWGIPALMTSGTNGNVISSLTPDTVYYASVSAVNGELESDKSAQVVFIPSATPPAPAVEMGTSTTIKISWSAVSGAATYDLYRSTDADNFTPLVTGLTGTSYMDSSIVGTELYLYRFLPRTAAGIQIVKSLSSQNIQPGNHPESPANLNLVALNSSSIALSWVPVSNSASYKVYRGSVSGGVYTLLSTISSTQNIYLDSTVLAGNNYYYVVTALNTELVESGFSNEVGVKLNGLTPSLAATISGNNIDLNWSAVSGATGYNIQRAVQSGGPYGSLGVVGNVSTFLDSNVKNGVVYYYVAHAIFADGSASVSSNEVSITGVRTMNLEVPIELTDQALSSEASPILFEKTMTSLDREAYDGTVTYSFEVVAINKDNVNSAVDLVDSSGASVGQIAVPAGTMLPTRINASFSPTALYEDYRLKLSATSGSSQLQVLSARMLIKQTGATKTKIYIPLLSSNKVPNSGDSSSPTETITGTNYTVLSKATVFQRDLSHLSKINQFNPWELEALVSTAGPTGLIGLFNVNQQAVIETSEAQFSDINIQMVNSPFNDGVNNFASPTNDLNQYQLAMRCYDKCGVGAVNVYKAGLWISLTDLQQVELIYRNSLGTETVNSLTELDGQRTKIDLTKFSNPIVNFRATAVMNSGSSADIQLMSDGTSDSGSNGLVAVSGSKLNFFGFGTQVLQTTVPLSIQTGDRFLTEVNPTGGDVQLLESALIIRSSP